MSRMTELDKTVEAIAEFKPYGGTVVTSPAIAHALEARAIAAQAGEQRITNLIALLDKVSIRAKSNVLDELGERLGIELF